MENYSHIECPIEILERPQNERGRYDKNKRDESMQILPYMQLLMVTLYP